MSIVSVYSINDAQIRAQFGKERIVADPQMGPNERFAYSNPLLWLFGR